MFLRHNPLLEGDQFHEDKKSGNFIFPHAHNIMLVINKIIYI